VVTPYYADDSVTLHLGDALAVLREMPAESVNCIVTSPPYFGLRDYGEPGQYGLEATPTEYVATMATVFTEAKRVLANDGTLWLNIGDTYAGKGNAGVSVGMTRRADRAELIPARVNTTAEAPYKSLLMIPERVTLALIDAGWTLRNRIIWHKTDAMPESVKDRLSNRYEPLFMLTKSDRYWFDLDPIREPVNPASLRRGQTWTERRGHVTRNRHGLLGTQGCGDSDFAPSALGKNPGDVWAIPTAGFPGAHFAVFPPALVERCILSGCRPGGTVLDPFAGSGTTGMVATKHGRRFVGIDLSRTYLDLALRTRLAQSALMDEVAL
jgi:site-specific DNA-methyltransferase (cytosine-N4-specific)